MRQAIRLNPNHANAHDNLGIALIGKGNMKEAIEEIRLSHNLDPENEEITLDFNKYVKN